MARNRGWTPTTTTATTKTKKATDVASPVGQSLSVDPYRNDVMCPARPKMRKNGNGKKGENKEKNTLYHAGWPVEFSGPRKVFFFPQITGQQQTTDRWSIAYPHDRTVVQYMQEEWDRGRN